MLKNREWYKQLLNIYRDNRFCNVLTLTTVILSTVALLVFAIGYEGNGWLLLLYSLLSLSSGIIAICMKSVMDLIFYVVMNYVVILQLITLQFWPKFIAFEKGSFSSVTASINTIDESVYIILFFLIGWFLVQLSSSRVCLSLNQNKKLVYDDYFIFVLWFLISIVFSALSAIFFSHGMAGIASNLSYEGIFYYLFPSDYLAIMLSFGLGVNDKSLKLYKRKILFLLVFYLITEVACGWKSPLLNVFLAYMIGNSFSTTNTRWIKLFSAIFVMAFLYVLAVKPIVNHVRIGQFFPENDSQITSEINPMSSRLTEGTLYGIATIEYGGNEGRVRVSHFFGDFINRLVPGTVFELESIDRVFTDEILGQPLGINSSFAPGIVGMGVMLGGGGGSFIIGAFFRFLVFILLLFASKANHLVTKYLIMGSIPIFIVSLCIDGNTGYVEKIFITAIIFVTIVKSITMTKTLILIDKSPYKTQSRK